MFRPRFPWLYALLLLSTILVGCHGYASELNRRAMAGLWRLTSPKSALQGGASSLPMKEFTVYPKKQKEFLLMLKQDGSFQQYQDEEPSDKNSKSKVKGTWDYLDGQLILAADRPKQERQVLKRDTIFVGKVVATSDTTEVQHPVMEENAQNTTTADTHLSVQGSVEVGKFFYPKNHPSFFEQPIFRPIPTGSFQLKQVLGNSNFEQDDEEEDVEKFPREVFYDKRFFLTSHPLEFKPKGRLRWSIKYNKFVEDAPKKKTPEKEQSVPIRVLELQFFSNHTFSTVAGLGSAAILRGKWDVIGQSKDQLWLQVWRFGFGRSVSGSVYSEGKSLSHDDAKTYWGVISYVNDDEDKESDDDAASEAKKKDDEDKSDEPPRLQVRGSVLYGSGLEPQPVARFIMKESTTDKELEEEEDEDDDDDTTEADLERAFNEDEPEDDIDWSSAFQ